MKTLFVWRGMAGFSKPLRGLAWNPVSDCQFCGEELVEMHHEVREDRILINPWIGMGGVEPDDDDYHVVAGNHSTTSQCPLCGWLHKYVYGYFSGQGGESESGSVLREFDLNSPEVTPAELGEHLKKEFSKIYTISPTTFERIVTDILRSHGLQAVRTISSRDGGADIILYSGDGDTITGLVECKRYAKHRKVGVQLVRQLVGAGVAWGIAKLTLVTSSVFTSGSTSLATALKDKGYTIELVDAPELLKMLQVYNEGLPPIDRMDLDARSELVRRNRELLESEGMEE